MLIIIRSLNMEHEYIDFTMSFFTVVKIIYTFFWLFGFEIIFEKKFSLSPHDPLTGN